jgi:outer membrane protein assembly factor BamB
MLTRFRSLLIGLLVVAPSNASDWPQFRGPTGDGVSQATNIPIQWSPADNVVWKKAIPGSGWSSPVMSGGKLYATSAVDADTDSVSLRALCVDAADGRIDWDVEVLRPDPSAAGEVHRKNSLASPTPIVDADRVYVHFGHMGSAALDLDGNVLWRQTALNYLPVHGNGGSPVLVDDKLVFSCDAAQNPFLAALDRASGEVRWKKTRSTTPSKAFSFSTPTVIELDGAQQIISVGSGIVGAYEPSDGREIWRVTFEEGYSVVPRPVWAHGLIFISTGFNRPQVMAIDPKGAVRDVTETHVLWSHEKGAPLTPSMLVVGDELYFVSDNGVASCLDARTGRVHWTKRLGGDFSASPVFAEGRIYFQNEAGTTYVVKAGTTYELLATNDLQEATLASPAVIDDAIFLRSESHLWRIGR